MLGIAKGPRRSARALKRQSERAKKPKVSIAKMLGDEVLFFRTLASRRSKLGAVSPSSRALARLMVEHAHPDPEGFTLELGPGTGVFTQALLNYGIPAERIVAVEHNAGFCRLLAKRFPTLSIVQGDAFDLDTTLAAFPGIRFSAALSGLPLLSFPKQLRLKCVEGVLDRMIAGKGLTQFSYGLHGPLAAMPGRIAVAKSKWVLLNLPPARVWTYRRPEGHTT